MEMRNMLGLSGMILDNQEGFFSNKNNSETNTANTTTVVVFSIVWVFLVLIFAILPAVVVYIYVPHHKVLNALATFFFGLVWIVVLAVYYVVLPRVNKSSKNSMKK